MNVLQMKKVGTGTLVAFCFVISNGLLFSSTARGQQLKPPPSDGCLGCSNYGDTRLGNERDRLHYRSLELERERSSEYVDGLRREFERIHERHSTWDPGSRKRALRRWQSQLPQYQADWGYRDGLDRGKEDVRKRRSLDPNNSSHYRKGTEVYREAFRRGYEKGYHP